MCTVEFIHDHPESKYKDLHPKCSLWNELQLKDSIEALWGVIHEVTDDKKPVLKLKNGKWVKY